MHIFVFLLFHFLRTEVYPFSEELCFQHRRGGKDFRNLLNLEAKYRSENHLRKQKFIRIVYMLLYTIMVLSADRSFLMYC
jgi:hypothetical protein